MNKNDDLREQMARRCITPQDYKIFVLFATRDLYARLIADQSASGQILMRAIIDWGMSTKKGLDETPPVVPACSCCDRTLHPGEVGGWIVLMPLSDDPTAIGSTGAFCDQCARSGHDVLQAKILQSIRDEFRATVTLQTMQ
jgi:bacterioferritin-associated ferredoxin